MMKKTLYILPMALWLVGCSEKQQQETTDDTLITERVEQKKPQGIRLMDPLDNSQSTTWHGRRYDMRVVRGLRDSSIVVTCDDGLRYYDNAVTVTAAREGSEYFRHRFVIEDFASGLTADQREHSILLGMVFNRPTDDGMIFTAAVGTEESEAQVIFAVTVAPDGSFRCETGDVFDEDEISRIDDPLGI